MVRPLQPVPLLHLGGDWQSARVPHAMGTGDTQPGQRPVEVSLIHRPPLHDPGAQHQFCNSHVYAMGTAYSHLFEVPTGGPLGQVCKTVVLPFLCIHGGNDLSYLNHIIIVHYNASYRCGKCMKQAFVSSSALHNHKKVCLGFTKKSSAGLNSKPSSGGGGDGSQGGGSNKATPKKKDSKAPATNSQGSSTPMALQLTPRHSRCEKSHCHNPHKDLKSKKDSLPDRKKKKKDASPTRKGSGHKAHKDSG